jgi:hypothetical protein
MQFGVTLLRGERLLKICKIKLMNELEYLIAHL